LGALLRSGVGAEQAPRKVSGGGAAPKLIGKSLSPAAQRRQQQLLYSAPAIDGVAGRGESQVMVEEVPPAALGNGRSGPRVGAGSPGAQAASRRPAVGQV